MYDAKRSVYNQIRIAYVLEKEQRVEAVQLLGEALLCIKGIKLQSKPWTKKWNRPKGRGIRPISRRVSLIKHYENSGKCSPKSL